MSIFCITRARIALKFSEAFVTVFEGVNVGQKLDFYSVQRNRMALSKKSIVLACLLFSCAPKLSGTNSVSTLNVNNLVHPQQEKWLKGQVENPTSKGFKHLVVFGDSLSDPGNLNRRTLGFFLPPSVFYRSRFSNGPIWTDYAQEALTGWSVSNFSVGGAKTSGNSLVEHFVVIPLNRQIATHQDELKRMPHESAVVAIWIGANNYTFGVSNYQDKQKRLQADKLRTYVDASMQDISRGIEDLKKLGFRFFMLGTLPELGVLSDNPREPREATAASLFAATAAHNAALAKLISQLQKQEDIVVGTFHAGEVNQATIDEPKKWGFSRLDAPCFVGSLRGQFYGNKEFCADPSGYKFWEFTHPNSKMHCYYASQFLLDLSTIKVVPGFSFEKAVQSCKKL